MIKQFIYLPAYKWKLFVFYWAERKDADEILQALQRFGAQEETLATAETNLRGRSINTGLTYTNESSRATIIVISACSSPEEFWNTLDHEKGHAAQHIGRALDLDYTSESQQYLAGAIGGKMYSVAKRFLCS